MQVVQVLEHKLPIELVIGIVDLAEMWPMETFLSEERIQVHAGVAGDLKSRAVLVSSPINAGKVAKPVRRIRVTTRSRDQGFSSFNQFHGTREGSSSWFELALVRPTTDPDGTQSLDIITRQDLFANVHASTDFVCHSVSLDRSHPCLDRAENGDLFVVYASAQYPMWSNLVKGCQLEVSFAIV
ncbi:hypothetical protein ACM66B_005908 [Microbotryomycetes sp. NB124-2]